MQIHISGQKIDTGEALRTHVRERLQAGIGKYFDSSLDAAVVFARDGEAYACTISAHVASGLKLYAESHAHDIYASFDLAAARMEKRLARHKSRLKDHKPRTQEDVGQYYVIEAAKDGASEDGTEPTIIAETPASVATFSVRDAVAQLDLSGVPVLMFRNGATGGLNVVYRRTDGHIGWIDPSFDPKRN